MNHHVIRAPGALLLAAGLLVPARGAVVIELDATDLPEGPLETWENTGSIEGDFEANPDHVASVTTVDGVKGVTLDGDNDWYVGPSAWDLTPDVAHSVEAWVHNPSAAGEETVFAWGRRGGPEEGSNVAFNHGNHLAFGAVGHWGSPDIGWENTIVEGSWTYIVYTYDYDDPTTRVYTDGVLANEEQIDALETHDVDDNGEELPFRVGAQNLASGAADNGRFASLTVARIRVHDETLSADDITARYNAEAPEFGLLTLGDNDNDGLPNNFEGDFDFLDPDDPADAAADQDGDGLTNLEEYEAGLDLESADGDRDGLNDKDELDGGTDPFVADTDQDGLLDGDEAAHETGPDNPDSDGDGYYDGQEVYRGSDPLSDSSVPGFDEVVTLVDLDARKLEAGPVEIWSNEGVMGGVFYSESVAGELVEADGTQGLEFTGNNWYVGPPAPLFVAGNSETGEIYSRSIDAWVWNPELAAEETIFAWGRRGGPDGSNVSFNHGTHDTYGAVGQWGNDADVGWHPDNTDGNPGEPGDEVAGAWTHVAYTYDYDLNETCVYTDGELTKCEEHTVEFVTHHVDNSQNARPLPFVLANQNEAGGTRTPGLSATMIIGRVRVYDTPLSPDYISDLYQEERSAFSSDWDDDGIPNGVEIGVGLDPNDPSDAEEDQDGDGLTNLEEIRAGTSLSRADTDGDGSNDGQEVAEGTDPLLADDSDQDGIFDANEAAHGTGIDNPDSDGDGYLDGQEVFRGSDPDAAGSRPSFDEVVAIVDLDAGDLDPGSLEVWTNDGAMGGVFFSESVAAEAGTTDGVPGVIFTGQNWYVGPPAPLFVAEDNSRSIDAWVRNPELAAEETIFAWGRRGGPDGSNVSFNHGTHDAYGAVGHWGNDADVGWHPDNTDGNPPEPGDEVVGAWTHIVYTYDVEANETCVYTDGQLTKCEQHQVDFFTHAADNTEDARPLPFILANQNEPNGTRTPALAATMTIGRVRVYDTAIPAEYVSDLYDREKGSYEPRTSVDLVIVREGNDIMLSWPAGGAAWRVEASEDLITWTELEADNTSGSYTDADPFDSHASRFYRVTDR